VPVAPFLVGQSREQLLGDEVLDPDEVGVVLVAVEQDTLKEVAVDVAAAVVRLRNPGCRWSV
jgi:hypothetical protein